MPTRATSTELLVPPRRLGQLLATARVQSGFSLDEASTAMGANWTSLALLEIETGHRPVLDNDLAALTKLYGIPTSNLIPARSHLVVDLDEGVLEVGYETAKLDGDVIERRDVLTRYLSMVYVMRDVKPGLPVPLRLPDLEILSGVLGAPRRQVEDELRELMLDSGEVVSRRTGRLRGRLLVPVIGVVVAVTAAGTLLLVTDDSDANVATTPGGTPAVTVEDGSSTTATDGVGSVPTEIGDAVVQERQADGTPGPVQPRD
jgi:transcriptional regulator with XRE-family HTH domain